MLEKTQVQLQDDKSGIFDAEFYSEIDIVQSKFSSTKNTKGAKGDSYNQYKDDLVYYFNF